ncbi:hypothetical protein GCM10023322_14900 [Rugosimonospora acidiphila]|uniref:Glycosyltransferase RgtA/B/C/D-like domain-containing protein n=1 Tax=Rugosimonospora acidiphila TaxID=556531 RepID=A0ABP9RNZ0_9ACTN
MSQVLLEPAAEFRPRPGSGRTRLLVAIARTAALVALAWLATAGADRLGADWLVPPLILVGTASLLRGGRTLLDRLVLALALLLGATCAAGLLFSVWPWGLDPPRVGGAGLTVLIVLGAVLRRRPHLPRPALVDALVLLGATGGTLYLGRPYLTGGFGHRLGLAMAGEDLARHFSIFDGIRATGGYLFLDPAQANRYVYEGIIRYPQGFHLTAALLDGFLRSSPAPANSTSAFDHFLGFHTATFGLLILAVAWAALWIGGPLVRVGARAALVVAFLVPFVLYTDLTSDYVSGYPSEVFGLALVALLVAVLARPLPGIRTQLVIVCALLVGIGFGYYLYLPGAAIGAGLWLLACRRRMRGRPAFTVAVAALATALALVGPAVGTLLGRAATALSAPASIHNSRDVLLALTLAIMAGALTRSGRRARVWRRYGVAIASMALFSAALGGYQVATRGETGYYFEKSLHALEIGLLAGVGVLARLVPAPARCPARPALRRRLASGLPPLLLATSTLAALGVVNGDSPFRPRVDSEHSNWGRSWARGDLTRAAAGRTVAAIYSDHPPRPGEVTLVFADIGLHQYDLTLFVSVLQRGVRPGVYRALYDTPANLVQTDPATLQTVLLNIREPIEAVTTTTTTTTFIRWMQAHHPSLPLRLVDLSKLS